MAAAGATTLAFGCSCGGLRGDVVDVTPAAFTHVVCHCGDCRSAYTHLGQADPRSVPIMQTTQDRVRVTAGGENLQVFRHSPRGALRWYAACCGVPLVYTPLKARLVHAGLNVDRLDDPSRLGAPVGEAFIPTPDGRHRHRGTLRFATGFLTRLLARNIDGRWRGSFFFGDDGAPIREPRILTGEERRAALAVLRARA